MSLNGAIMLDYQSLSRLFPPKYCTQCRVESSDLKQCSRCKLTVYCSRKCQIKHFKTLHKHSCQQLAKLVPLEKQNDNDNDNTASHCNNKNNNNDNIELELANTIFHIAYQSCDTIERGAHMFVRAFQHYQRAFHQYNDGNKNENTSHVATCCLQIMVLILTGLGQLQNALEMLSTQRRLQNDDHGGATVTESNNQKGNNDDPSSSNNDVEEQEKLPANQDFANILYQDIFHPDMADIIITASWTDFDLILLILIQSKAHLIISNDNENELPPWTSSLTRLTDSKLLDTILNVIPLTSQVAPTLTLPLPSSSATTNIMQNDVLLFLQDAFMLTPGLYALLDQDDDEEEVG